MQWSELEEYQRLIGEQPALQKEEARRQFEQYVGRMWEPPTNYMQILQAYLEFSTPAKLTFPKLAALPVASAGGAEKPAGQRSRRSRRRKRKTK